MPRCDSMRVWRGQGISLRTMSTSPAEPMTFSSKAHATTEESRYYFATSARATANSADSNTASVRSEAV